MAETHIGPEDPASTFAPARPGDTAPAPAADAPAGDAPAAAAPAADTPAGDAPAADAPAGGPARRLGGLRRRGSWLIIAVPAVASLVLGGYRIGGPSLWRDEAYTKDAVARPVGQMFTLLSHADVVHGAYYLVMHVVTAVIGTSATALRLPSLIAMVIATAFTAAIGRRAAAAGAPADRAPGARRGGPLDVPALTGLFSGLLFAAAPYMTYYAQMARSYAIETMFATIATYLLLRAVPDGRWRWWLPYAAAVALTGLFNVFGLLILAAHGVTLLLTGGPGRAGAGRAGAGRAAAGPAGAGRRIGRIPLRWLAASAAALVVLGPLLATASHQQQQIGWLSRPSVKAMERLLANFAGSRLLILPIALLVLGGLVSAWLAADRRSLNPAAIALPWLVVPPVVLVAVSFVKPVYYPRYVEFCLPALAILAGAGLAGLVRLAAATPLGRLRLAWLPAALVLAGLAALLAGPQQAIRQSAARPDNLRLASAIVAAHEQPGDVVFYIPLNMRVLGTGYPGPFMRLRDIARARSPIASATLTGTEVTSPAVLKSRFTDVRRVWVVTGDSNYKFPKPFTAVDKEKMALLAGAGLHILHRWMAGEVMLTLYG